MIRDRDLVGHAAAALGAGRLEEAEALCRRAISAGVGPAVAQHLLGLIAHRRGDYHGAVDYLRKSLAHDPGQAVWHFNLGVSCRAAGLLDEAQRAYAQAVRLDPAYAPAHYNLGSVRLAVGDETAARGCFESALKHDPSHGNACFQLGSIHRNQGNIGKALKLMRRAVELLPGDEQVRLGLGVTLLDSNGLDGARAVLEPLTRSGAVRAEACAALARVYERLGRYDDAHELIEPLIENPPVPIDAALMFADLAPRIGKVGRAIELIDSLVETQPLSGDQRMLSHFALGRLYDKQNDAGRAFDHFRQANGLKSRAFDPAEHEREVDAILHTFTRDMIAGHPKPAIDDSRPVFIVGMPRSGTSLVEQVLATHPAVVGGGELPDISNFARQLRRIAVSTPGSTPGFIPGSPAYPSTYSREQLDEMARLYVGKLDAIGPKAERITDKTPSNFLYLGLIALILPGARVIHCKRDPMASCWSCYTQNFVGAHAYSYDLTHLGLYYRQYERLMRHWRGTLDIPLLEVDYGSLVADPEPGMREIVGFCGLPWDDACLRFYENKRPMPSASYDQVRQPIYTSSVDRWRRYESYLGPLRDALDGSRA
ncbi:MAG: sulfotransferase [Phycisphaerales bacterium]